MSEPLFITLREWSSYHSQEKNFEVIRQTPTKYRIKAKNCKGEPIELWVPKNGVFQRVVKTGVKDAGRIWGEWIGFRRDVSFHIG